MYMHRQENKQISKRRIEEIVNYLLENFYTAISGQYSTVYGINLDLNDEDDEFILDIRQDVDLLNQVLKGINKKTTNNLKSKISRFMNIKSNTRIYNTIGAFKISGMYEFPVELYNFRNLTMLHLMDGDIPEIPDDINNLSNLLELNITNCPNISELPETLTNLNNLMSLEISDVQISEIPEDINKLSNLLKLSIKNCPDISELPDTLSNLNKLRILEISGTNISNLPDSIGHLPYLRELILEQNDNLNTLPESLIENKNNINIKTDYSYFYKDKMDLENISNMNKSTIVLAINGHGSDLCDEPLYTNLNKLLYFSYAPKYSVSIMDRKCPSIDRITNLMNELNSDKAQISDVIEQLENISSDEYNIRDRHDLLNKYDELTEERNEQLRMNRNVLLENQSNLVFKVRAIKNDHLYYFHGDADEEWEGKYGIYVLDIRNPKNKTQNNYKLIAKDLNSSKVTKLSDVLNNCYETFGFDYVAIIDTSCRMSSTGEEPVCNIENIYKKRGEQLEEITKGRQSLKTFKHKRLGGKSKKNKKNNRSKKRNYKKRNNKKSIKNKKIYK
jgi:Leucine-rich repeat (LRR) protein